VTKEYFFVTNYCV